MSAFGMIIGEAIVDPVGTFAELERKAELTATETRIHQQTASGGTGDVHVEMEYLVDFYNTLSQLHDEVAKEITKLRHFGDEMYGRSYGGQVPGVQKAWLAMTEMIGANGSKRSLVGNLQAFDNEVVKCMSALHQNAQAYSKNEQVAVEGFGRAAGTGHHHKKAAKGQGSTHKTPAKPAAAKSTASASGFGGQS